jgi:hypothetical protein
VLKLLCRPSSPHCRSRMCGISSMLEFRRPPPCERSKPTPALVRVCPCCESIGACSSFFYTCLILGCTDADGLMRGLCRLLYAPVMEQATFVGYFAVVDVAQVLCDRAHYGITIAFFVSYGSPVGTAALCHLSRLLHLWSLQRN